MSEYCPGELFVYSNGDKWELGLVKSENYTGDGYFCYYSRGDTASNTPIRCMHKLSNAGWTKIEQNVDTLKDVTKQLYLMLCSNLAPSQQEFWTNRLLELEVLNGQD